MSPGGLFIRITIKTALTTPYIATASQKITETKFLNFTLGDFIADPNREAPDR